MNSPRPLRLLNIVLSIVLAAYGMQLAVAELRAPHRLHALVLLALGIIEAVGAGLFLVAIRTGGAILLISFAAAAVFHLLHGELSALGALVIYAASVVTVMSVRERGPEAAQPER